MKHGMNTWDVHRSMSWNFFFLSVVVDNDEIWKSWNFKRHSHYRFPAGAIENLGGSLSKMRRGVNDVERAINL